jgi:DNA polymerase-3 subunit beta
MKFTTTTGEIQRVLSKVGGVVPTKSTMPILENFLFDLLNNTLTITATDLEISQTTSLDVKGSEDGKIAVPAKRLNDTVRALPDTELVFAIDTTSNKIKITTKSGEYHITGEGAKDFPAVPPFNGKEEISLDSALVRKIIHRTSFAVSTDELRPAMMGVLLQSKGSELRSVATDGHRLVRCSYKTPKSALKKDIIIPAKALNIVSKSIEGGSVKMGMSDTHVKFEFDKNIIVSRLIDETYPNYESVIPTENDKTMTVNREQLAATVRRVALYASATTHQIRLGVVKSGLTVSAQDVDFGGEAKENLECEYTSDSLDIGFNSTYLVDILSHLESEQVSFKFSSPTRAGIVSPAGDKGDEDVLMLVMPVRLNT